MQTGRKIKRSLMKNIRNCSSHTKVKTEAEALEKDIEYKKARKNKLTCVIKAYKHSKIITEFSEDLWNGLLDKCLVYNDHIEFRWK